MILYFISAALLTGTAVHVLRNRGYIFGGFITLFALFCVAMMVFPSLRTTLENKTRIVDQKIAEENVVDNFKGEYVNLTHKKADVEKIIQDFTVKTRVSEKKLEAAKDAKSGLLKKLQELKDRNDVKAFNIVKSEFESVGLKVTALEQTIEGYKSAKDKSEAALALINSTLSKQKAKIDDIETRKQLADNFKEINDTLSNIEGIGSNESLNVSLEALDEKYITESTKLEIMNDKGEASAAAAYDISTQKEMEEYIETCRK